MSLYSSLTTHDSSLNGIYFDLEWWKLSATIVDERADEQALAHYLWTIGSDYGIGAGRDSFTVTAIGNIDNDLELDVWIINHDGQLININDDYKLGDEDTLDIFLVEISTGNLTFDFIHTALVLFLINFGAWIVLTVLSRRKKALQ